MVGKKVYRSSQGKSVDLGALLLQNETVRAVGNMGVNARGDRINIQNKVIDTKNKISQRAYNKQIGPQDVKPQTHASSVTNVVPTQPVAPNPYELQERNDKEHNAFKAQRKAEKEVAKANKSRKTAAKKTPVITEKILDVDATAPVQPVTPPPPPPPAPVVEPTPKPIQEPEPSVQKKATGLADAIARAKTIKQESVKTPRQQAQEKSGVKRI
ncbi:hypothetical protein OAP74_00250 [bacterium]|nr:hypothetical protein [bacterium]